MVSTFLSIDGDSLVSLTPTSYMTGCMTTETQARLDDEIAALTSVLCNLRSRRNTLSSISRLPPEILSTIFVHCARIHQQPQHIRSGIPDWIKVSYICRHWRDVALNCPTLWSFLFASSQQWTEELLARSKAAPLKVCVDSGYSKQSKELNLLKKVAPQADRIQNLNLRLTRREAERILSLFSSPAPLLQRLRISVERSNYLGEPALSLTGALFDGDTPALRNLELINYAFPLTSPTFRGLTSLRLRDLGTSFQPTLGELRVALSRMQDLVHLHLENALPSVRRDPNGQSFENPEKLRFPRLSRLSIIAPLTTVILLLSRFDLPLKTEVRLRCCFEGGAEDYTPIYPLLAKRFIASEDQGFALAPIIRTCFVESASATVGFIFSTAERDSGRRAFSASTTAYDLGQLHEDWDCNIPLKVDVVLQTSLSWDREKLIGGVCRSMPLTNLQSAHFSFDVGTALSSAFWRDTFGHLEELRHIKLSEVDLLGLVRVLSISPHHNPRDNLESGSGQIFTPALEELELYNVKISKECRGLAVGTCSCSEAMTCLYDALASRQVAGHGLRQLTFADYVYWDGITRMSPGTGREKVQVQDCGRPHRRFE